VKNTYREGLNQKLAKRMEKEERKRRKRKLTNQLTKLRKITGHLATKK